MAGNNINKTVTEILRAGDNTTQVRYNLLIENIEAGTMHKTLL
jgi:hypothetical protein